MGAVLYVLFVGFAQDAGELVIAAQGTTASPFWHRGDGRETRADRFACHGAHQDHGARTSARQLWPRLFNVIRGAASNATDEAQLSPTCWLM